MRLKLKIWRQKNSEDSGKMVSYNIDNISEWTEKDLKLKYINKNHWIFSNVFKEIDKKIDLPEIYGYYKIENKNSNRINILKLINNDFFFAEYKRKNGSIFLCTSPLNNNNFSNHSSRTELCVCGN